MRRYDTVRCVSSGHGGGPALTPGGTDRGLKSILSAENPARLSRAEYRVCLKLSRGRTLESVQFELGVTRATVRTHLRNIYAKTNTTSQPELISRLLVSAAVRQGRHAGSFPGD